MLARQEIKRSKKRNYVRNKDWDFCWWLVRVCRAVGTGIEARVRPLFFFFFKTKALGNH
jgi:hypothetical protein